MGNEVQKIIDEFQPEKQYGYIPDIISDEDYVLGSLQLPTEIIQPTGQWDDFIPQAEIQRTENYETYGCTIFGTLNALEFLFKRVFGETKNWAERFVYIFTQTRPPGNSPKTIIENIRKKCGVVDEDLLPMSKAKTYEEYISPDPLPVLLTWKGEEFLKNYQINYEWVFNDNQIYNRNEAIKTALQYSPLGIAVYAWQQDSKTGFYIRPEGKEDTHWVCIYGYEDGKNWKCYDSYDSTLKRLDWNFGFERCLRYRIEKIEKIVWWDFIRNFFKKYKINLFQ